MADDLVAAGLGTHYKPPPVEIGGAAMLDLGQAAAVTLLVLGHTADLVAVTGIRPPLLTVSRRIATWINGNQDEGRKYSMMAFGPNGKLKLDLDEKPDPQAVVSLLETVYGKEADAE